MRRVLFEERTLRNAYCSNGVSSSYLSSDPSPLPATHLVEVRPRIHASGVVELRKEGSQASTLQSLKPAESQLSAVPRERKWERTT